MIHTSSTSVQHSSEFICSCDKGDFEHTFRELKIKTSIFISRVDPVTFPMEYISFRCKFNFTSGWKFQYNLIPPSFELN